MSRSTVRSEEAARCMAEAQHGAYGVGVKTGRVVLGGMLIGVYAWASFWLMTYQGGHWAVALGLLAPLVGLVIRFLWRSGRWALAGVVTLTAILGVAAAVATGIEQVQRLYVAQHVGVHLGLGAVFAASLWPGRTAMITALARGVHREFTPAMAVYTRRLTLAWVLYFGAVVVVSLWVYVAASWTAWSLFSNVLGPLSLGVFFVGEHVLRYWWHPEFERVTLSAAWQAFEHEWRRQQTLPRASTTASGSGAP